MMNVSRYLNDYDVGCNNTLTLIVLDRVVRCIKSDVKLDSTALSAVPRQMSS